jgi:hypothetical protein
MKKNLPVGWALELYFLSGFPCEPALQEIFLLRFIYTPKTDRVNNSPVGWRAQKKINRTDRVEAFILCAILLEKSLVTDRLKKIPVSPHPQGYILHRQDKCIPCLSQRTGKIARHQV